MRRGILMILANVAPENEAEFNRWYDREHMRERVEVPGFLSAQRYRSAGDSPWRYLALYETESLATFKSPVYQQALAHQSNWSKAILGLFRDPQRAVTERSCRHGYGIGGVVSVTRLRPAAGQANALREAVCAEILPTLARQDGVIQASLLEADAALSRPVAEYPKGGLAVIRPDDWLVIIGAVGVDEARFALPDAVAARLTEAAEPLGTFSLMWNLHRSDLGGSAELGGATA